ncbi:MAG TPA: TonB family protein [Candidatus Sulfotelmatobacter sp.]
MSIPSIPTNTPEQPPDPFLSSSSITEGVLNPGAVAGDILEALRRALGNANTPTESIFYAAADAARVLTGAQGGAIALQTAGGVICRARSGESAPELGSMVNIESGITGACFRTSQILRCNDTQTDDRVDAELCLLLRIRSIAAVPVRNAGEPVGILEVFSSVTNAFGDKQLQVLALLGGIVEAAYERESGSRTESLPDFSASLATPHEELAPPVFVESQPKAKHHHWIFLGAVAMLLLASVVVWRTWREPAGESGSVHPVAQTGRPGEQMPGTSPQNANGSKPSPRTGTRDTDKEQNKGVLRNAAKVEPEEGLAPDHSKEAGKNIKLPARFEGSTKPLLSSTMDPPTVVVAMANSMSPNTERLNSLTVDSHPLPALDVAVSHGVVPARAIHRVEPKYPEEALTQKLSGPVTLEATVSEKGTVGDVKTIRGEPILAAAAIAAVRQWRYSPCLLNGRPVPVQKEITVVFKLP